MPKTKVSSAIPGSTPAVPVATVAHRNKTRSKTSLKGPTATASLTMAPPQIAQLTAIYMSGFKRGKTSNENLKGFLGQVQSALAGLSI